VAHFVGIDQALTKIGICVLTDGEVALLHLLKPPRKVKGPERLKFLRDALAQTLEPYRDEIRHAALEGQSLGSVGDIDGLGQINGVVQVLLTDLGVKRPLVVPPGTLKKFVSGNGQAKKSMMRRVTRETWKIDIDQDDLCDAHGLARFAEEYVEKKSVLRHQIEAIHRFLHGKKRRAPIKTLFKNAI